MSGGMRQKQTRFWLRLQPYLGTILGAMGLVILGLSWLHPEHRSQALGTGFVLFAGGATLIKGAPTLKSRGLFALAALAIAALMFWALSRS